jgi:hypothetical protein
MEIIAEPVGGTFTEHLEQEPLEPLEPLEQEPLEQEPLPQALPLAPPKSRGRPKGAPNKPKAHTAPPVLAAPVIAAPAPVLAPAPRARAQRPVTAPVAVPQPPPSLGDMMDMLARALVDQKAARVQQRREMYRAFLE